MEKTGLPARFSFFLLIKISLKSLNVKSSVPIMDGKHDSSTQIACSHTHNDFTIKISSVTSKGKKKTRKVFGERKLELSFELERLIVK